MNSPKAVVFDLGKVLLDFDYARTASRLEAKCQVSPTELRNVLDQSPLLLRYEAGLMTTEEFFEEVRHQSGFRGSLAEFGDIFGNIFTPIEPMIRLHSDLRTARVPTCLFSNTNALAVQNIRRRFPFFQHFDSYVLSFEHRAMKPDPKLYEVVERATGHRGSDLLYIDDRPENIATGRQRGWQTVLHRSPEETIGAVRELGILRPLS